MELAGSMVFKGQEVSPDFALDFYSPLCLNHNIGPCCAYLKYNRKGKEKSWGKGKWFNFLVLMAVFLYPSGEKNNLERCIMIAKLLTEQSESSENSHSVTMSPKRWEPARTHDAKLA